MEIFHEAHGHCDKTSIRMAGGGQGKRVYIEGLDLHLKVSEAQELFSVKGALPKYGCRDTEICPNGIRDMLEKPGACFAVQRIKQVRTISDIPVSIRPREFVTREVIPLTNSSFRGCSRSLVGPKTSQPTRKKSRSFGSLETCFQFARRAL